MDSTIPPGNARLRSTGFTERIVLAGVRDTADIFRRTASFTGNPTISSIVSTPIDPFENGIPRRRLLKASAATGAMAATASAGCLGEDEATESAIFVFNTGDMTVSMIDPSTDELLTSEYLGGTASWPSNQYAWVNP